MAKKSILEQNNFTWKRERTHMIAVKQYTTGHWGKSKSFSIHTSKGLAALRAMMIKWFAQQTIFEEDTVYEDRRTDISHYVIISDLRTNEHSSFKINLPSFSEVAIAQELELWLCGVNQ